MPWMTVTRVHVTITLGHWCLGYSRSSLKPLRHVSWLNVKPYAITTGFSCADGRLFQIN